MHNNDMDYEIFLRMLEKILNPERTIVKDFTDEKNVNPKICSECGGECCKRCGCHFSPDDFEEISFEFLKKELEKGYISIDYVDGEFLYQFYGIYILRMRNQDAPIVDTWYKRSPCILLTENGCKLDYEHRPTGGKLLIPSNMFYPVSGKLERICRTTYGIEECCYEWRPYQKILHELVKYFKDKDFTCSII